MTSNEAVYNTLSECLSSDPNSRMRAELHLFTLTRQFPDYPAILGRIAFNQSSPIPQRHLAAITLKNYVDNHWNSKAENFVGPETTPEIKAEIRSGLIQGLADPEAKIRVALAHIVSKIAHVDWPENWSSLFDDLMILVKSGQVHLVHGAMSVMTDFVRDDITDQQLPYVTPILLPEMLTILNADQVYQTRIRARSASIFREFINLLHMVAENTNTVVWLRNYVPGWLDSFAKVLANPITANHELVLKLEVMRCLNTLISNFPKFMNPYIESILGFVWTHIQTLSERHITQYVNPTADADDVTQETDTDGELVALDSLLYCMFEFIEEVSKKKVLRGIFTSTPTMQKSTGIIRDIKAEASSFLKELCRLIITYSQITHNQEESWLDDINQFIQDDEDETFSFSVRVAAQELLICLVDAYKDETIEAIVQAVINHLEHLKHVSVDTTVSWKIHEACLLALGRVSEALVTSNTFVTFDVSAFLSQVVEPDVSQHEYPFLKGRALWFLSQLASVLPKQLLDWFARECINALCTNQSPIVKIFSIKAIIIFCMNITDITVLNSYQGQTLQGLASLAESPLATEDGMPLILNCLLLAAKINITEATKYILGLSQLLVAVWTRHASDPVITEDVLELVEILASNNETAVQFQEAMIPEIARVMASDIAQKMAGIQAAGIDIWKALLSQNNPGQISPMYSRIFPELMQLLLNTADTAILQNGQLFLKTLFERDASIIVNWSDGGSVNGMTLVMSFLAKGLDPTSPESAGLFLGELIITVIKKAGNHIAPILHSLLSAITNRLATAEMPTFIQSLILVFAHLIVKQRDDVVRFLAELNLAGKSGLQIFIQSWCENYLEFQGYYSLRLNATAMSQLYQSPDTRLHTILVKGDEIVTDHRIRTRSSTKNLPHQFTTIPFLAKAIKLLLADLMQNVESFAAKSKTSFGGLVGDLDEATSDTDDEDDDEEDWEDIDGKDAPYICDDMNEMEDPDDPLFRMNLKEYLVSFFKLCYANDINYFKTLCSQHLNAAEQGYLSTICT